MQIKKAPRIDPETGHNESAEERNQNLTSNQIKSAYKGQNTSLKPVMREKNPKKNERTIQNHLDNKNCNSSNKVNLAHDKKNMEASKNDTSKKILSGDKIQSNLSLLSPPKTNIKRNSTKKLITPPPSNSSRSRNHYTFPVDLSKTRSKEHTPNSSNNLTTPPAKNSSDNKHSNHNDTIGSEHKTTSSHPKIPLSRTRARPYRIQRSNSAPLSSGKSTLFPTHSRTNSIESFVESNEILAIPARRRSISTHSGEYDIATQNSTRGQSTIQENDIQIQLNSAVQHRKNISYNNRDRLGTETSENITEEREYLNDLEENLGSAMEHYLNDALTSEKAGEDIEVEIEPDILRAETPAGVILVNRADPRFFNGMDVENSSILSHSDDLELSSDENDSLENEINMDQILSGYGREDENSISDGSLFDDTIGLDNEAKKSYIYDTKPSTIGDQNSIESLDYKTYPSKKKLDYSHDNIEKKQNSAERNNSSSGSSELKIESVDNNSQIKRRVRPIRTSISRSKKNNQNDPKNKSEYYPIMVDGFDYQISDSDKKIETNNKKKTSKNRRRKKPNDRPNVYRTINDEQIDPEYQSLIYKSEKKANNLNIYGTGDKFNDRMSDVENEKDYEAVFRNDTHFQRPQSLPTQYYLYQGQITHHCKTKDGVVPLLNETFSESDYRMGNTLMDTMFSSVRSMSTTDFDADVNDSEKYNECSMFERAFPERIFALLVTLAIELLVLMLLTGDDDNLCNHMGKHKYHLMLAFLPLLCSISGNSGLQSNALTTRSISHSHVTKYTFKSWLYAELGTALILGVIMGLTLGLCAYQLSEKDILFGMSIAFSQLISIVISGLTGSISPLVASFFFPRNSGKWGGLLETAIQDVVGCFVTIAIFHCNFVWPLGHIFHNQIQIDPIDACQSNLRI